MASIVARSWMSTETRKNRGMLSSRLDIQLASLLEQFYLVQSHALQVVRIIFLSVSVQLPMGTTTVASNKVLTPEPRSSWFQVFGALIMTLLTWWMLVSPSDGSYEYPVRVVLSARLIVILLLSQKRPRTDNTMVITQVVEHWIPGRNEPSSYRSDISSLSHNWVTV